MQPNEIMNSICSTYPNVIINNGSWLVHGEHVFLGIYINIDGDNNTWLRYVSYLILSLFGQIRLISCCFDWVPRMPHWICPYRKSKQFKLKPTYNFPFRSHPKSIYYDFYCVFCQQLIFRIDPNKAFWFAWKKIANKDTLSFWISNFDSYDLLSESSDLNIKRNYYWQNRKL